MSQRSPARRSARGRDDGGLDKEGPRPQQTATATDLKSSPIPVLESFLFDTLNWHLNHLFRCVGCDANQVPWAQNVGAIPITSNNALRRHFYRVATSACRYFCALPQWEQQPMFIASLTLMVLSC